MRPPFVHELIQSSPAGQKEDRGSLNLLQLGWSVIGDRMSIAGRTNYSYDQGGKPIPTKEPKLLLNDNDAGKPEGIHLMIGRRPVAAFGNSTGDQQMLEYTGAEYAYGPALEAHPRF